MSGAPPAAVGTISLIGFSGHAACADGIDMPIAPATNTHANACLTVLLPIAAVH
ncbi:hypothetical protein OJJOAM_000211 [Cupriavidus sp. H18C1]